jgi:mono/diheme cytochrome c family protein
VATPYLSAMLVRLAALIAVAAAPALAQEPADRALYLEHCGGCHGDDLTPISRAADLKKLTDADRAKFDEIVLDGRIPRMPEFRGVLTPPQIDQIWVYLRAR